MYDPLRMEGVRSVIKVIRKSHGVKMGTLATSLSPTRTTIGQRYVISVSEQILLRMETIQCFGMVMEI